MTIDISLLRNPEEGGNIDEVKKWQTCRLKDPQNNVIHIESLIAKIIQLEKDKRRYLKDTCQCRARVKDLQKALAPKEIKSKSASSLLHRQDEEVLNHETLRNEIDILKKQKIPSLTEELDNINKHIEEMTPKLMNIVDEEPHTIDKSDDFVENYEEGPGAKETIIDPLYCIEGYEKVSIPTWNHPSNIDESNIVNMNEKAVLCGFGSILSDSLTVYAQQIMKQNLMIDTSTVNSSIHLPAHIPVSSNAIAHSLMGCQDGIDHRTKKCTICSSNSNSPNNLPSYIAFSMLHQNKSYTDRELPKKYICNTDVTERIGENKKVQLIHQTNRVELSSLSTCNLKLSRHIQDEFVNTALKFYESLLISNCDINNIERFNNRFLKLRYRKNISLLRTQSVPPTMLHPNECRRIMIQGFLPSKGGYVELGAISNYTDYISRNMKIKCGGGHGQPIEYAYLVHGIICDQGVMQWLLENNIASLHELNVEHDVKNNIDEGQTGVIIPPCLLQFMRLDPSLQMLTTSSSSMFIPYARALIKRKGGKVSSKPVKGSKEPIILNIHYEEERVSSGVRKVSDKLQPLVPPCTSDEAACNPYGFLPFHR